MANFDIFYFAHRARRERERADQCDDARAFLAHKQLERSYVLTAMRAVIAERR